MHKTSEKSSNFETYNSKDYNFLKYVVIKSCYFETVTVAIHDSNKSIN